MKIAFIGQKGMPAQNGGVETYVESLATNLAALRQDVLVYNRQDYLPEVLHEFRGVTIINKPYIHGKNFANITHTFLAVTDVLFRDVDIIHFQGIGPSLLCWIPKLLKPKVKIIATLHSFDYYNDKWSWLAKKMLFLGEIIMCHCADEVIVLTKSMQNYIKEKHGKDSILIPNGANLYDQPGDDKLLAWGLKKGEYILSVCRIIRLKGLQYLISAYKKINTDKKLVIVGDGEYLPELEKLAAGDNRIIFAGNQTGKTLDQFYANAYLFVQPSEMEGLSIALLEAMSHRSACLVSNIEPNIEAVNGSGFTFASKDTVDLQSKLEQLLIDRDKVNTKAQEAYDRVKQYFTWPNITQKTLTVYKKSSE